MVGSLTISLIGFNYIHTIAFSHTLFNNNTDDIRIFSIKNPISSLRQFEQKMLPEINELPSFKKLANWIYLEPARVWLNHNHVGQYFYASKVNQNFFKFLGQEPALGRFLTTDDFSSTSKNVVVISHLVWQEFFQGDPDVIGKFITVDQAQFEVVGVMGKRNHFPIFSKLWLPLKANQVKPTDPIDIIYKLSNETNEQQIEAELSQFINQQVSKTLSSNDKRIEHKARVESLTLVEQNTDGEALFIFTLFLIGIVIILLISSINIGNLLYARILEKQKESAIRAAIGAPVFRIVQQHACEGGLYAIVSWVLALLLTSLGLDLLTFYMYSSFGAKLPYWWYWQLNGTTIMVSVLLVLLVFVFSVLLPALKTAKFNINNVLRDGTRGATSKQASMLSKRLLAVQVTLVSFMLMVASTVGYVMMSIATKGSPEQLKGMYSATVEFNPDTTLTNDDTVSFINALTRYIEQNPAFVQTSVIVDRPELTITLDNGEPYNEKPIRKTAVTHLFQSKLTAGRNFNELDNLEAAPVCIISISLAKALFGTDDVIGKQLRLKNGPWQTVSIIGIAEDEHRGVATDTDHELYVSARQVLPIDDAVTVIFKTEQSKAIAYQTLYDALGKLPINTNVLNLFDFEENHDSMLSAFTTIIFVFVIVGGFALTLSLIGIYAMGVGNVNRSQYEIGIRRSLGAKDSQILWLFIHKNSRHIVFGIIGALIVFYGLCFLAVDLFQGNVPLSVMFLSGSITVLVVLACISLALYMPVKKIITLPPAVSLRMD